MPGDTANHIGIVGPTRARIHSDTSEHGDGEERKIMSLDGS
jgi:hypothetical protein